MTQPEVVVGRDAVALSDALSLAVHLPDLDARRFGKLFAAPARPPVVAVARNASGEAVGMGALHRIRLLVDGSPVEAAIAGDFVVVPEHRTLGLAMGIQRSLLRSAADEGIEVVVGDPNTLARGVFKRLGYQEIGASHRYVRAFSVRARVGGVRGLLAQGGVLVSDAALRAVGPERWGRRRAEILRLDRFDERFEGVWESAAGQSRVVVERTVDGRNRRFELNGEDGPHVLFAHLRGGAVASYAVIWRGEQVWCIVDLLGFDSGSLTALLANLLDTARQVRVPALAFWAFASAEMQVRAMRKLQFIRRAGAPPRVLVARSVHGDGALPRWASDRTAWMYLGGDLDG